MNFKLLLLVCCFVQVSFCDHLTRWAQNAWRWLEDDFQNSVGPRQGARVYIAYPNSTLGKLKALSADHGTKRSGRHDGYLVIDTTPELRFGHPVHMFFIDLNHTEESCSPSSGKLLKGGDCLTYFVPACHHRRTPLEGGCPLMFLPEIRSHGSNKDLLRCSNIWSPCPKERIGGVFDCDPTAVNYRGCQRTFIPPCSRTPSCFHATMMFGGWNKRFADEMSLQQLRTINQMLRRNGFNDEKINIFYGNGLSETEQDLYSDEFARIYPSNMRYRFRFNLKSICEISHCASTVFVYINSPTKPNGESILWDFNSDGQTEESEIFPHKEILDDLANCKASRIILIVDQPFSLEYISHLERNSQNYEHLYLFTPGPEDHRGSLVDKIANIYPGQCINDLKPRWVGSQTFNSTLTGQSCTTGLHEKNDECYQMSTIQMLKSGPLIL